jgi:signal transduction histidine kinase
VLCSAEFRLQTVIEAAMEIAGLHAAQKRLQIAYNISHSGLCVLDTFFLLLCMLCILKDAQMDLQKGFLAMLPPALVPCPEQHCVHAPHASPSSSSPAAAVPAVVVGDAQRLQQILLNIVSNAVKFTEQGEILLEVWAEEETPEEEAAAIAAAAAAAAAKQQQAQLPPPVTASLAVAQVAPPAAPEASAAAAPRPAGSAALRPRTMLLQFSVRDTGIGISEENIGRLFQSFSQVDASPTRRHGGSGLGLAICQRLCEAMGGRMWAESGGPGEGSLFRWCIRTRLPKPRGGRRTEPPLMGSSRTSLESRRSGGSSSGAGSSARSSADLGSGSSGLGSPLPPPALAAPGVPTMAAAAALSNARHTLAKRRVLLVEACPMVRHVLILALQRWGCAVCAVSSEAEGMARIKLAGTSSSSIGAASGSSRSSGRGIGGSASNSSAVGSPPQVLSPPTSPTAQQQGAAAGVAKAGEGQQQGRHQRWHIQLEHAELAAEADCQVGSLSLFWPCTCMLCYAVPPCLPCSQPRAYLSACCFMPTHFFITPHTLTTPCLPACPPCVLCPCLLCPLPAGGGAL